MSERKASPFWNFSLKLYRVEGVATACLKLQDLHGIEIADLACERVVERRKRFALHVGE